MYTTSLSTHHPPKNKQTHLCDAWLPHFQERPTAATTAAAAGLTACLTAAVNIIRTTAAAAAGVTRITAGWPPLLLLLLLIVLLLLLWAREVLVLVCEGGTLLRLLLLLMLLADGVCAIGSGRTAFTEAAAVSAAVRMHINGLCVTPAAAAGPTTVAAATACRHRLWCWLL